MKKRQRKVKLFRCYCYCRLYLFFILLFYFTLLHLLFFLFLQSSKTDQGSDPCEVRTNAGAKNSVVVIISERPGAT